jgi:hypothetical protein
MPEAPRYYWETIYPNTLTRSIVVEYPDPKEETKPLVPITREQLLFGDIMQLMDEVKFRNQITEITSEGNEIIKAFVSIRQLGKGKDETKRSFPGECEQQEILVSFCYNHETREICITRGREYVKATFNLTQGYSAVVRKAKFGEKEEENDGLKIQSILQIAKVAAKNLTA